MNGPKKPARIQVWPVLTVGFGALVILIAFSGLGALRRATSSYAGISALLEAEQQTVRVLGRLRADLQGSAIAARDFLLESEERAQRRDELLAWRITTTRDLSELAPLIATSDPEGFDRMRRQVDEYWLALNPILTWTPARGAALHFELLIKETLPRRRAALDLAAQIDSLAAEGVKRRRAEIDRRQAELPRFVLRIVSATIVMGLLVAGVSILRIFGLENAAEQQQRRMADAEMELRALSRQLVRTQEEERRALSRELHDQVGQLLTAIRIGLGNVEEALGRGAGPIHQQIEQTRRISEQALRSVRDLAMGLRPSMLDDLGLGDALQWQARQHSRLCGVPVTVQLDGDLDDLAEAQRTCAYRVVQEALNNIAKHAEAGAIEVEVGKGAGLLSITIRDDGRGFDLSSRPVNGLGIVGIKERVRQLGGQVEIASVAGRGTSLGITIPLNASSVAS